MDKFNSCKILLVDDDPSWQMLNKIVLEKQGFRMDSAYTKYEAFQKIQANRYEIAIVDLRLVDDADKNFDGLEVVKFLRKRSPSVRILVESGYLTPEVRKELNAIDIDGILDKATITNHDLAKRINQIHQEITHR